MSVFRVEKTKGYTVMSNHHLRNHALSLKAKGLLSQMLSLPDDWDYTLQGLAQINKESIDAIREAVRDLERAGYIKRSRERDERGCLRGTVYTIYEQPHAEPTPEEPTQEKPALDNPTLEKPMLGLPTLENPTQLNTESTKKRKRQSKDSSITDSIPFPSGFPESPTQKRTETKGTFESYRELILENIDYDVLASDPHVDQEQLDEIVDLVQETVCSTRSQIRVAGNDYPAEVVRSKLLKLNSEHIRFVMDCLKQNTTRIRNIRQYLLATLFNAPSTMSSYYTALVAHDTNDYGFITDYLSEFLRELRKESFGDALDKYFKLGSNLNQRDTIAVRKMVSGMLKLLYPDGDFGKEEVREVLTFALEMRRRVKEQLKKIGGMEFYDVNFSFVDNDSFEETFVSVPEQGGGKLIPDGMCNPGHIYTVSRGKSGMIGVYRLETQMLPGNGKLERTGLGTDREAKESTNTAFNYLKANANAISGNISTTSKDYIINYQDLNGIGITKHLALPTVIAICSVALSRPTVTGLAVLGDISISGTIMKVEDLANVLQVCLDSGAKKVLLPITSAADIGSVPSELVGAFSLIFYSTPQEAVFKALGVD